MLYHIAPQAYRDGWDSYWNGVHSPLPNKNYEYTRLWFDGYRDALLQDF